MATTPGKSGKQTPRTDRAADSAASSPAPGRRERRKQALRQHIFDVAVGLFTQQGFDATTVEQIADAADIAPATFFNHFDNKQVVLIEMTNMVITHLQGLLDEELERDATIRERLVGFAAAAAADIGQARSIAREVVLTIVRSESDGLEAPYLTRVHQPFAQLLREGQQQGVVRDDLDADFLAQMVVGMMNATVTSWLARPDYPIEKEICQAAEFAWQAVQAPVSDRAPRKSAKRSANRRKRPKRQ